MKIQVLIFGQITGITGSSTLTLQDIPDTDTLQDVLKTTYPGIANIHFSIAVNKQIIQANTLLDDHTTVALLPPFSGG
jgi:molybdopterin synthase sulfur carrier subunit